MTILKIKLFQCDFLKMYLKVIETEKGKNIHVFLEWLKEAKKNITTTASNKWRIIHGILLKKTHETNPTMQHETSCWNLLCVAWRQRLKRDIITQNWQCYHVAAGKTKLVADRNEMIVSWQNNSKVSRGWNM